MARRGEDGAVDVGGAARTRHALQLWGHTLMLSPLNRRLGQRQHGGGEMGIRKRGCLTLRQLDARRRNSCELASRYLLLTLALFTLPLDENSIDRFPPSRPGAPLASRYVAGGVYGRIPHTGVWAGLSGDRLPLQTVAIFKAILRTFHINAEPRLEAATEAARFRLEEYLTVRLGIHHLLKCSP